jgi:hypothetical protein
LGQVFRKTAQADTDIMKRLNELTRKDNSTMKALAALGTVFLPATFVSVSVRFQVKGVHAHYHESFFSMPMLDWDAPSPSGIAGKYFWLWWAVTIPLSLTTGVITLLWIKSGTGRDGKLPKRVEFATSTPTSRLRNIYLGRSRATEACLVYCHRDISAFKFLMYQAAVGHAE